MTEAGSCAGTETVTETDACAGDPIPGGNTTGEGCAAGSPVALTAAVLTAVRDAMSSAPAAGSHEWSWEDRSEAIQTLDRVVELLALYRSGLLCADKADGRWARRGDRSFESYRGRTGRAGWGEARREMELADGLQELPQAARAVEDGEVGLAHARVITRLTARASEPVREALTSGGAEELLAAAKEMDAAAFAKRAEAWAAAHDTDAVERSHEQVRRARFCRVTSSGGGTRLEAFLDAVAGASVRTALEALTPAPAADHQRTSDQRRADALSAMAARVLERGADKIGAQIRPHLSLLVPAPTWAAIVAARPGAADGPADPPAADGAAGRGADSTALDSSGGIEGCGPRRQLWQPGGAIAMPELDDGTVVPLSEVQRIACDCEMTRLVLGADGVPLDVGRTERTYTKSLRRAVLVRDRHCRWPGCTMRASWCEVHHLRWWSRGGRTSLDNGLTLCTFHHHEVHRRNVQITLADDGHDFTLPDGSEIGRSRRPPVGRHRSKTSDTESERPPDPQTGAGLW